jgi:hypothetical protein
MNTKEHIWHYLILVVTVCLGLVGVIVFSQNPFWRFISIFGSVLCYVGWGAWHHYIEGRLSWVVLSEYLLIALVVLASASLILFPL